MRSLLAFKHFDNACYSNVVSSVLDKGRALFGGLNVAPKRFFQTENSRRIESTSCFKLMRNWFETISRLGLK